MTRRGRILGWWLLMVVAGAPGACRWTDARGEHQLVVGLGEVCVQRAAPRADGARATRQSAAGVLVWPGGLLVGALWTQRVEVARDAGALVEARGAADGSLDFVYRPVPGACPGGAEVLDKGVGGCNDEP